MKVCGKCGQEHNKKHKNGGRTCPDCVRSYASEWRRRNKDRINAQIRERYKLQSAQMRVPTIVYRDKLRRETISAYGGECACCGESTHEFLTIDHVRNDGAEHRRKIGNRNICLVAKEEGYPNTYQVLCWNCNCAKAHHGKCPHA